MPNCIISDLSHADCLNACSPLGNCVVTNQSTGTYCCDYSTVVKEGMNLATKILIGCCVGGSIILILSIIGCYFCCCHKGKTLKTTVFVQGGSSHVPMQNGHDQGQAPRSGVL
ncbi:Hypothetical_protein [Hexamita inflata]|uniref:Hypothetical_protein n=1 Tax=Hexamita inflata TaxID=28002 RepID=A0AA86NWB7_9EUKA|nr:Hypothetical protein HINF_LOCUS14288 [Hexamita inflata]CAI9926644.1 Hypothetical protein HINF_LOCUS14289 [Hexamita inflata]